MAKQIHFEGTTYKVPDDATDDEITEIVGGGVKPPTDPAVSRAIASVPRPAAPDMRRSLLDDPQGFLSDRAAQMGAEAKRQNDMFVGPESSGLSLASRFGHGVLSYLPATAQVVDKAASGLFDPKNAVATAALASPVTAPAGASYLATQATGQLTGLTPGINRGDYSPDNIQNALLSGSTLAGVSAGMTAPRPFKAPTPAVDPIRTITDAVNPTPKQMQNFEANLRNYVGDIKDTANQSGKAITGRQDLANFARQASNDARQAYYDKYITPNQDLGVYGGKTIQDLDRRLTQLNGILAPAFEKGGGAATRAALSPEAAAAYSAEAQGIRTTMNEAIGKKMGIDPSEVAAARQKFGALGDIADKSTMAINRERYTTNANSRGIDLPTSKAGVISMVSKKLTSKNPDAALATAFKHPDLGTVNEPTTPGLVQPAGLPRKPPAWMQSNISPAAETPANFRPLSDYSQAEIEQIRSAARGGNPLNPFDQSEGARETIGLRRSSDQPGAAPRGDDALEKLMRGRK